MNEKCIWIAAVTFGATLAALIVGRLDDQALAILTGAACGVAAGVPISVAIIVIHQRQQVAHVTERREPPQPVIVVQPPAPQPQATQQHWSQSYAPLPPQRPPRHFNIIGDEEDDDGDS
jgi:hypothetical protein